MGESVEGDTQSYLHRHRRCDEENEDKEYPKQMSMYELLE